MSTDEKSAKDFPDLTVTDLLRELFLLEQEEMLNAATKASILSALKKLAGAMDAQNRKAGLETNNERQLRNVKNKKKEAVMLPNYKNLKNRDFLLEYFTDDELQTIFREMEKGLAWLDKNFPGWEMRVHAGHWNPGTHAAGQLAGHADCTFDADPALWGERLEKVMPEELYTGLFSGGKYYVRTYPADSAARRRYASARFTYAWKFVDEFLSAVVYERRGVTSYKELPVIRETHPSQVARVEEVVAGEFVGTFRIRALADYTGILHPGNEPQEWKAGEIMWDRVGDFEYAKNVMDDMLRKGKLESFLQQMQRCFTLSWFDTIAGAIGQSTGDYGGSLDMTLAAKYTDGRPATTSVKAEVEGVGHDQQGSGTIEWSTSGGHSVEIRFSLHHHPGQEARAQWMVDQVILGSDSSETLYPTVKEICRKEEITCN